MRLPVKKWFVFTFTILVFLVLGIYLFDRSMHCKINGLPRGEALQIAKWKLGIEFADSPLLYRFQLASDQLEPDKSWVISYRAEDCITYIVIDKCGVADVGGLSKACLSRR